MFDYVLIAFWFVLLRRIVERQLKCASTLLCPACVSPFILHLSSSVLHQHRLTQRDLLSLAVSFLSCSNIM